MHTTRGLRVLGSLTLVLAVGAQACGKKDTVDETPTTTTSTGGVSSNGGGTAATGATVGTLTVGAGLNALPDLETMFNASVKGLGLTPTGTPPHVPDIAADVSRYLTGDVDATIAQLKAAVVAHDWEAARGLVQTFHDAQAKCRVMEDTARQVQDLSDMTGSTCRMKKIGAKGAGGIKIIAGTDPGDGNFFAPADEDIVRVIDLKPGTQVPGAPKVGSEQMKSLVFHIAGKTAAPTIYKAKLTFCSTAGKALGAELITVDGAVSSLSYESAHQDQSAIGSLTMTRSRHAVVSGTLAAAADGTTTFDGAAVRTLKVENRNALGDNVARTFNARVEITGSSLVTTFFGQGVAVGDANQSIVGTHKGVAMTTFTGDKAANVAVSEGAGKHAGTFKVGSADAQVVAEAVGFEYDEAGAPRYVTVATSTLLDAVNAVDFTADAILKQAQPVDPDLALMTDDDCDVSSAAATAVVSINTPALQEAMKTCETKFVKMDEICRAVDAQERDVFTALQADKAANPPH